MPKYAVIWEFEVKPEKLSTFEELYGPHGEWVQLFRQGTGFLHTNLVRDIEKSNRYLVLDYWQSRAHYLEFREAFNQPYDTLNEFSRFCLIKERLLGAFEVRESELPLWAV
jgi:quinol monooxygenase YgiN